MNKFQEVACTKDLCSWCYEEIINEVYVLAINKTYCRPQCMVSDMQWARQFVQEEQADIAMNNDLAKLNIDRMYI